MGSFLPQIQLPSFCEKRYKIQVYLYVAIDKAVWHTVIYVSLAIDKTSPRIVSRIFVMDNSCICQDFTFTNIE